MLCCADMRGVGQSCATGYSSDGNVLTSLSPVRFPYVTAATAASSGLDLSYKSFSISMWVRLSKVNQLQCIMVINAVSTVAIAIHPLNLFG
jgi:hypothetical protein